jgi:cell division protein FtsI (penicillin-binding protein 3)
MQVDEFDLLRRRSSGTIQCESARKRAHDQFRARLIVVIFCFIMCFSAIGVRLTEVSLNIGGVEEAENRVVKTASTAMGRREITDRNGMVVATSLTTYSLFAHPHEVSNPQEAARQVATVLPGMDAAELSGKLGADKKFVWVRRNLTPREQYAVNRLGIPGLYFEREERRVYPYGPLLAHILGYVGIDNRGLAGLERSYDKKLLDENEKGPLQLSIDLRIQTILSEEIRAAIEEFRAIGGVGVVTDVKTGEILAMSSLPEFDPNQPGKASKDARFNRATLGVYEMGSTFKAFTMASALHYGVADMTSSFDARFPIRVARYTISDSHPEARWLTLPEVFYHSSNIGTVKIAQQVGVDRQREFMKKLGLLEPLKFDLKEVGWPLIPNPWREINMMTVSYGHGISVTPLHLVRAFSALAGEGRLMPLTLIRGGNDDKPLGERVISPENVQHMRELMRLVVSEGTGSKANAPGYFVGGKTGTAEKVNEGGGYNANNKLALFAGVFPVHDPRYCILVMIDEPRGNKKTYGYATGGWVAAPVVGKVVSRMGPLMGIKPHYEAPNEEKSGYVWSDYRWRPANAVKY